MPEANAEGPLRNTFQPQKGTKMKRIVILSMLPLAVMPGAAEITSLIGPNRMVFEEEETIPTAWVQEEDARYEGIEESGEPNRPEMSRVARYPLDNKGQLRLLLPEDALNFEEEFLRPAYIFSDIEPPSPTNLELDGDELSLSTVIRLALDRNMDVQIIRMEREVNDARLIQAMSDFDPVLEMSTTFEVLNRPQNTQEFISSGGSPLDPGVGTGEPRRFEDRNQRYGAKLSGKSITGTTYELDLRLDVLDNTLVRTSEANIYDPEYSTRMGVSITHPLARDSGKSINLAPVKIARKNREISELEIRAKLMDVVSELVTTYLDMIYDYNEIRLRKLEVETLQLLAIQRTEQVERGVVSVRQLREIQAQLGESLDRLLQAEQRFEGRRKNVLRLISSSGDPDHNRNFIPVGQMQDQLPDLVEEEYFKNALQYRADYLQAIRELELDEIELDYVKNQTLPRVDFVTSGGVNGLEGDAFKSFNSGFDEPYLDFTVGVVFSRPWNNSGAKARVREIRKRRMQSVMEIRKLEHETAFQIRTALSNLEQLKKRHEASSKIREYFQLEVKEEQLLLEKGNRSIYDTLQFFTDLSDAKTRELSILTEMNKALIQLYRVDGSLLDRLGIEFVE